MSDAVEVCIICDIAGCHHIRERKARADLSPTPEQIAAALDLSALTDKDITTLCSDAKALKGGKIISDRTARKAALAEFTTTPTRKETT